MKKLAHLGLRVIPTKRSSDPSLATAEDTTLTGLTSRSLTDGAFVTHSRMRRRSLLYGQCSTFSVRSMASAAVTNRPMIVERDEEDVVPDWLDEETKEKLHTEIVYENGMDGSTENKPDVEPERPPTPDTTTSSPTTRSQLADAGITFSNPCNHSNHLARLPCTKCNQPMSGFLDEQRNVFVCLNCDHVDENFKVSKYVRQASLLPEPAPFSTLPIGEVASTWTSAISLADVEQTDKAKLAAILAAADMQHITSDTLSLLRIRLVESTDGGKSCKLLFPIDLNHELYTKEPPSDIRPIDFDVMHVDLINVTNKMISLKRPHNCLYSYESIRNHRPTPHPHAVLTTSLLDAMAVAQHCQATNIVPIVMPLDDQGALVCDEYTLAKLSAYPKITLWVARDNRANLGALCRRLGAGRCRLVLDEATPHGLFETDITRIAGLIAEASNAVQNSFFHAADISQSICDRLLNAETLDRGIARFRRHPPLDSVMGGLRLGELTIVSGGTGDGKTTLTSELAVDFAEQGVPTMFCSFEMPLVRMSQDMAIQHSQIRLDKNVCSPAEVRKHVNDFCQLPILFIDRNAVPGMTVADLSRMMRTQIVTYGVQFVVMDNLQFLISNLMSLSNNLQKSTAEEELITMVRRLATEENVHVLLVTHVRKEMAGAQYTLQSLIGSSRLACEADTVLIVNKQAVSGNLPEGQMPKKFLHVPKNRHNGETIVGDKLELRFNSKSKSFKMGDRRSKHERVAEE